MRRTRRILAALLLATLAGCGGGARVSGSVRYQGKPVLSGSVIVLHADGTACSGVIQPDGTYTVSGVKPGPARLGVLSPDPARARPVGKKGKPEGKAKRTRPGTHGWFPLPAQLGDPEKSGLICDMNASNVRHDIDVK